MNCRVFCVSFTYQCFRVLFKLLTEFMKYVFKRDGVPRYKIEEFDATNDSVSKKMNDFYKQCALCEDECCEDK